VLSGGERNRLLLARLFTKPANVLVLDEPTNDLDAETLDLLEDLLVEYQGTLLVVSHDRDFLDNVVTGTLVFEGEGRIGEYVGGYTDWTQEQAKQAAREVALVQEMTTEQIADAAPSPRRKLTNRERSELAALPARIEALEQEQAKLTARLADPQFYKSDPAQVTATRDRLVAIEEEHHAAFVRWEELEARE
jgi:ATP-binding cassette subfamily F protein uup